MASDGPSEGAARGSGDAVGSSDVAGFGDTGGGRDDIAGRPAPGPTAAPATAAPASPASPATETTPPLTTPVAESTPPLTAPPPTTSTTPEYAERLWVPWTWWVLGLVAAALLCLEVTTTLTIGDIWRGWQVITVTVVAGFLVGWLVSQSQARVAVTGGDLVAGPARLPIRYVGEVRLVDADARRRLMGPAADPAAYTFVRAWIRLAVLIEITDPDDPTPYWLVSTRHPRALAAALGR